MTDQSPALFVFEVEAPQTISDGKAMKTSPLAQVSWSIPLSLGDSSRLSRIGHQFAVLRTFSLWRLTGVAVL